jgi:hypothetical protein
VETIVFFKAIKKTFSRSAGVPHGRSFAGGKSEKSFSREKFAYRLVFRGERAYNKQALVFCGFLRFNFSRRFE